MVPLREFMLEGWGDTQLESHQAVHGGSRIHVQLQFLLVRWLLPRFSHPYSWKPEQKLASVSSFDGRSGKWRYPTLSVDARCASKATQSGNFETLRTHDNDELPGSQQETSSEANRLATVIELTTIP